VTDDQRRQFGLKTGCVIGLVWKLGHCGS